MENDKWTWAHSIVVVHGISGPKTWVRFPVCSSFLNILSIKMYFIFFLLKKIKEEYFDRFIFCLTKHQAIIFFLVLSRKYVELIKLYLEIQNTLTGFSSSLLTYEPFSLFLARTIQFIWEKETMEQF